MIIQSATRRDNRPISLIAIYMDQGMYYAAAEAKRFTARFPSYFQRKYAETD
jgi:hypothetical protein